MIVETKDKVRCFLYDYTILCTTHGISLDDGDTNTLTVRELATGKRLCEVDFDFRMDYEIKED